MNAIKKYLSNKPGKIASDLVFVLLILLLIIPQTRSRVLSGVASIRSMILPLSGKMSGQKLDEPDWNWQLTDLNGNTINFADLKGETIFLNQWATWCPPCRAEMPSIEKLYKKMGGSVTFILLTNESLNVVREYLDKHEYTFPVYLGRIGGNKMASRTIPATSIIGPDGEIVVHKSGAYNWYSKKVRKLLEKTLKLTGAL
jgi:thiol-disulfide isomerase/thioredoxin